jgi:hypothetical protein
LVNATGAGPFTTIAAQPADGLAHPVTLASTANLSTINMTIVGTNAEGNPLTEVIAGPNNNTVTTLNYFKTITSVTNASTLGANTMNVGWTAIGVTPMFPLSVYPHGGATLQVALNGTTCNYTPQYTMMPVLSTNDDGVTTRTNSCKLTNDVWKALVAAGTADTATTVEDGATAVRVLVNSHTTGTITLGIAQPCR